VLLASLYRHPFITYTFVVSVVFAALLGILLRVRAVGKAKGNPWFFLVPLVVPVLSYIIITSWWEKRARRGRNTRAGLRVFLRSTCFARSTPRFSSG